MNRKAVVALLATLALAGAWWLSQGPDDPAEQVRVTLRGAVEAFDLGRLRGCLEVIDSGWTDDSEGRQLDHDTLRLALISTLRGRGSGRLHCEVIEPIGVQVADSEDEAAARFELRLGRTQASRDYIDDSETVWRCEVDARLQKFDGDWRITRSSHRSLEGAPPTDGR